MREIFGAFLLSFGVVFLAELGDKSQLLALLFATRMRTWLVLVGIAVASGLVHLVSVGAGHYLSASFDPRLTTVLAGVALIGCGLWGLRERLRGDEEPPSVSQAARNPLAAIATVVSAFVLAELGDKTLFATVALGAGHSFFGVWLGATAGMVTADGLAIALGSGLARRVDQAKLAGWANGIFLLLGAVFLVDGLWLLRPVFGILAATALLSGGIALIWLLRRFAARQLLGSQR